MRANIFNREILSGSCLVFETQTNSFKSQWHSHPEYELVFINNGNGILQYGSTSSPYKAGDLFLFGPWIPHEFIEKSHSHHSISCIFHAELLSLSSFKCEMSDRISRLLDESLNGIRFQNSESSNHFFNKILQKKGLKQAIELLLYIDDLIDLDNKNSISDLKSSKHNLSLKKYSMLQNILKYINDNIEEEINIEKLTNRFFVSRSSLARLFGDVLQVGVSQYITQQRLFYACRLLATTDLPITKICSKVGFGSLSSFNRSFQKYKSMSPREYRENKS